MSITPRKAAVLSLNSCIKNGKFVNLELDASIKKYGFEDKDKSFFTILLYGTIERKLTLDYVISRLSSVRLEKIESLMLCILETGLYQIFYMDRVPDSAACNEATELVKTTLPKSYAGYANAVLRAASRQKAQLLDEINKLSGMYGMSIRYSVPEWLCELWEKDYGCAEKIVKALSTRTRGIYLRVNTLKTTAQELCDKLMSEGLDVKLLPPYTLAVHDSCNVQNLYGYDEGLFFVQDPASTMCSSLISTDSIKTDSPLVIDTCACPGGKSFSAAINLGDKGHICSFDLHKNRLRLVDSGAQRLGLTSITTAERDGRVPDEALFGKADAVICDVPCSGLGVIAKKPDIRYKTFDEIEKLPTVQLDILESSAKYVKKGGFIVYSTCTLRKAENEDVVNKFLENNLDFWLHTTGFVFDKTGMATFLPQNTGTDGFFAAKLIRK